MLQFVLLYSVFSVWNDTENQIPMSAVLQYILGPVLVGVSCVKICRGKKSIDTINVYLHIYFI